MLLSTMFGQFPFLEKLFADSAYAGPVFHDGLASVVPGLVTEIVRRSDRAKGFVVAATNDGSSNEPSVGWVAAAASPRTGKISTTTPSPSSASPPSA